MTDTKGDLGLAGVRSTADFLCNFNIHRKETRAWLSAMLPFSTQNAWVHDPHKK